MKGLLIFMGLLDLNAVILLVAIAWDVQAPTTVLVFIPVCLILKAGISIMDPGSVMDLAAALLIILSIFFVIPPLVLFLGAGFLLVKSFRSFGV
jgi:hypothetical protein